MTNLIKALISIFPIKRVDDFSQKHVVDYKYFLTQNDIELFERGAEDTPSNLQSTLTALVDVISQNEVLKKYLDSESGVESSDDKFMFYFHNSLTFIIHEIYGVTITNFFILPYYERSAHQFFKEISDKKKASNYFKKIKVIIDSNTAKSNYSDDINPLVSNPYKLNGNYNFQDDMQVKFNDFSNSCQNFINLPSSNFTNLETFFSGGTSFKRLEFEIASTCVRKYFEDLHLISKDKGAIIKCPKKLPIKFLGNITTLVYKVPKKTVYSPLNILSFRKNKSSTCGPQNLVQITDAINKLK